VLCDETKDNTADILTPHEREIAQLCDNNSVWQDVAIHLKFALKVTIRIRKTSTSTDFPRKIQLLQIGSRPRAFPPAIDEVRTLPLSHPKVGSKSEFAVFVHTIPVFNLCLNLLYFIGYKVSSCENFQRQSCRKSYPISDMTVHNCGHKVNRLCDDTRDQFKSVILSINVLSRRLGRRLSAR